ncbi:hypothetical protein Tco_0307595 [Tanacetum coccineum]
MIPATRSTRSPTPLSSTRHPHPHRHHLAVTVITTIPPPQPLKPPPRGTPGEYGWAVNTQKGVCGWQPPNDGAVGIVTATGVFVSEY